jgi:hypothetical protein
LKLRAADPEHRRPELFREALAAIVECGGIEVAQRRRRGEIDDGRGPGGKLAARDRMLRARPLGRQRNGSTELRRDMEEELADHAVKRPARLLALHVGS